MFLSFFYIHFIEQKVFSSFFYTIILGSLLSRHHLYSFYRPKGVLIFFLYNLSWFAFSRHHLYNFIGHNVFSSFYYTIFLGSFGQDIFYTILFAQMCSHNSILNNLVRFCQDIFYTLFRPKGVIVTLLYNISCFVSSRHILYDF